MHVVHKVDAHIFFLGPSCSPTGNIFTSLWPQSLVALGQSHCAFNKSCTVQSQSALNSGWTTVELPGKQKRKRHTAGRLRYGVWLMGALSRSAAEKLSSLSLSSFVDKWFWNWRPTEINITGIRKINGTTKIARTWIAPVQFLPTLYRLLDHPISLSQSVREGAAAGEAGCGRRRVTELQWAGCEFPNP